LVNSQTKGPKDQKTKGPSPKLKTQGQAERVRPCCLRSGYEVVYSRGSSGQRLILEY
jgi:hypothetical protein